MAVVQFPGVRLTKPAPAKWLVRPYEATNWQETTIEPTDELRRFLEFKPIENAQGDVR